jgi:hypothetical protein
MKKITALLVSLIVALTLFGCSPAEQSAVAYGITHKDYVGVATVTVENDVIKDVALEEYYLPYTWAKVAVTSTTAPADVVVLTTTSGETVTTSWYAKYIVIGDRNFTGEARTESLVVDGITYSKQTVKYVASDVDDLFVWLLDSGDNCAWYVAQLETGTAYVAKDTFAVNTTLYPWNQGNGFTKSATGYWYGSSYPLGWEGNMDEVVAAVIGTAPTADAVLSQDAETKFWSIGDTVTGATLTDFADYYRIIVAAFDKAIAE